MRYRPLDDDPTHADDTTARRTPDDTTARRTPDDTTARRTPDDTRTRSRTDEPGTARCELSVVIATYNRAPVLDETLRRLDEQTLSPERFEVIVVDDGSTDGTRETVAARMALAPYRLRYFKHENRGPGYTENVGIRAAECRLVLLIADDIWPAPDLLLEHLRAHERHPEPEVGAVGKVEQSRALPPTVLHAHWDPFQYGRFEGQTEINPIVFNACNVSVKRDFLLDNGLFREHRGAAHEDIELGYRLSQKGLKLRYLPDAMGFHHHPETLDGICRRAYERGLNFHVLSDNVPPAIIFPLYKIATLEAGPRAFLRTLPRELLRWPVFNRVTVELLWKPVLRRAETSRFARWFARGASYRGVAGYYLRAGYRRLRALERRGGAPTPGSG